MPRWLISLLLVLAGCLLLWAMVSNAGRRGKDKPEPIVTPHGEVKKAQAPAGAPAAPPAEAESGPIEGLRVREVAEKQVSPVLGSADPAETNPYAMELKLTPWGGGIQQARLAHHSIDVALENEDFTPYVVQEMLTRTDETGKKVPAVYPMAAESVMINGASVVLHNKRWEVVQGETDKDRATFAVTIEDAVGKDVLRIRRVWSLAQENEESDSPGYAVTLRQGLENLSGRPLRVVFSQYGPGDLPVERGYVGDQRHVILGYLQPYRSGEMSYITTDGFHLSRGEVLDEDTPPRLWPGEEPDERRQLLWVTLTNRYFAAAIHAPTDPAKPRAAPIQPLFPTVERVSWGGTKEDQQTLAVRLTTARIDLPAGASRSLDVELYAGPKDPKILEETPVYARLGMGQMIVYNLGGCCARCTFDWITYPLLGFLRFIHWLVKDWGVAIIVLVAVVRTILHPLTKSSQVNMMKLSKQMASLQPEMEKIKAKYPDSPQKQSQEIWALQKERGVNPASMGLGCLPMFLQTPIWIALYAMLYFAIELRQEPAFWGVFQRISAHEWPFLADLSSQDRFIPLPESVHFRVPWIGQTLDAINILPILMGFVFYFQQKYMTPPNPNMSPEMRQQQVMMKWMTVILFPLMLFWAPSGLTLYILTSTFVGIIESKRVRAHVKELEESGRLHEKKPRKEGGVIDKLMKAASKMAEEKRKMFEEQQRLQRKNQKKRKDRP